MKKTNKTASIILISLVIWTLICVAFYYYSIKAGLIWVIHLFVWLSIPTLTAAIVINAYFNIKYNGKEKPDEGLVCKVRTAVKTLIIIGLPPISCVFIEYIAGWLLSKI